MNPYFKKKIINLIRFVSKLESIKQFDIEASHADFRSKTHPNSIYKNKTFNNGRFSFSPSTAAAAPHINPI